MFKECRKNNFKHPLSNRELPIVSDAIYESVELYNDKMKGTRYSRKEMLDLPRKVYELYDVFTSQINENTVKKMQNQNKGDS